MSNKAIQKQLKQVSDPTLSILVALMNKYLKGRWTEGYNNFGHAYDRAGNSFNGLGDHWGEPHDQETLDRLKLETNKVPFVKNGKLKFITIEQMEIATKKTQKDIMRSMGFSVGQ